MLSILRALRERTFSGRYLQYAAGEVLLIITGIMLVLSFDNWMQQRDDAEYELLLLSQIEIALLQDRAIIDEAYLTRLERKEAGLFETMRLAANQGSVSESHFLDLFDQIDTDFVFSYDSGAYEALRTSGLDRLSNNELRTNLIAFYDFMLPAYQRLLFKRNDIYDQEILQLRKDIVIPKVISTGVNEFEIQLTVKPENVLSHPSFLRILEMEDIKAANQRARITFIIERYEEIISTLGGELE
ncbi:MAG: hypothetical protein COA96_14280 [SAR86 cluster bacterium]|uniref:Uncharacterized protein n=1 Tax=SAR86 cluster bacterium TaxID=2030880 RepID=A0A2A5AT57_9GAMM|nr:MAG: hypothetical protein COA96_14280 [SAR86 cluster bacterium]